MKPIYEPKGAAKEYCDFAVNIYTGCNHGCLYCYAPRILHKTKEQFAAVEPRKGIVDALKKQIVKEGIKEREIQLCFTCDPYPADIDTTVTRQVIEVIKNSGNHVRILTKGGTRALRDFDLLDGGDWFGVTYAGYIDPHNDDHSLAFFAPESEPNASSPSERLVSLERAYNMGIKTWVSMEPIINAKDAKLLISHGDYIGVHKIGKLNYHKPEDFGFDPINWHDFGHECERLCKLYHRNYYIKQALRAEMEENNEQIRRTRHGSNKSI